MKILLFAALFTSLACAQGTKLAHPVIILPPAAGGVSAVGPKADVGARLGTPAIRWDVGDFRTLNARTVASGLKSVQITGNGVAGVDAIGNNTFNLSTVVGTGFFGGGIAICDVIVTAACVNFVAKGGFSPSYTYTMPGNLPGSTQLLTVNNIGEWHYTTGFTCGGVGEIQYNDGGTACGHSTALTFDAVASQLVLAEASMLIRNATLASTININSQNLHAIDGGAYYGEKRHGPTPVAEFNSSSPSTGPALRLASSGTGALIDKGSGVILDKNMNLFVDSVNSFSTVLAVNGAASTNGNILLRPGNVAANSSVYAIAPRLDEPALIIADASGTTTGNSLEFRTFGGTVYAKMIGGSDAGAPGQFGTNGFFCITSGTCNLGFTTNRFVHVYGKELNASTASGSALTAVSSDAFGVAASIDNTGGGSALSVSTNCASCIAFGMTNANPAGVQLQFGPGGAGGIFSVSYYVNNGAPAGGCNNGDMYHRKDGAAGTTFYGCRSGAWAAWF